ncbi:MAG: helix-turn-helix transcriptional regulator [Clostridia bacterium]|nr:helix-turn-helix transcriptional regulator [Clostridia bacterium]
MNDNVFGSRLRKLRKEKGLTQKKLAERLGYDYSTISAWEIGKQEPCGVYPIADVAVFLMFPLTIW